MQASLATNLQQTFRDLFGASPRIHRAPGRVNLIGEHTDYNDGIVMPAAIGFFTHVASSPRNDRKLVVQSENFHEQFEFSLDDLHNLGEHHWANYVLGVAAQIEKSGYKLPGANLVITGDVPLGSGLSSSASLEVAVASALFDVIGSPPNKKDLALLCQRAENEFVGARCGIMDQFIASFGRQDRSLLLDCRSLEYRYLPLPRKACLIICNTMVRHSVAAGEYNQRRAECEEAVRILKAHRPEIRALRDATLEDLENFSSEIPALIRRRCHHVITENARVEDAASALQEGNLDEFGSLMRKSHASLRDDYEVSCGELDLMSDLAEKQAGVYGARMTGGGFGGCTVNLVRSEFAEGFQSGVARAYEDATGMRPEIYICSAADGVQRLD